MKWLLVDITIDRVHVLSFMCCIIYKKRFQKEGFRFYDLPLYPKKVLMITTKKLTEFMFYVLPCCSFTNALCFTIVSTEDSVDGAILDTYRVYVYVLPCSIFGNSRSRQGDYFCGQSRCLHNPRFMFYVLPCAMC